MARGMLTMPAGMSSNPYPKPKEHVPRLTHCELCDRQLPTKDWTAHKNSKKHREAEAKERGETFKSSFTFGGDANGSNEFANANDFGSGDAFANTAITDGDGWGIGADLFTTKYTNHNNGDQRSCFNCGETGHQKRDCPQVSNNQACFNCGETGHRKIDCPQPRKPLAGGAACSDRLCFNCNQPGHNKSDCNEPRVSGGNNGGGGGGGGRACHNCGEEGHMSRDCDKPRVMKCRNCDEEGHAARECTKPRDWSRVKCRNCNDYGHGEKRCPKPPAENTGGNWGDASAFTSYNAAATAGGWDELATETTGNWAEDATAAAEGSFWGNAEPAATADW